LKLCDIQNSLCSYFQALYQDIISEHQPLIRHHEWELRIVQILHICFHRSYRQHCVFYNGFLLCPYVCVCVCVSQGHEGCFFFLIRVGHPQILIVNACTTRQDAPNTCQSITESSFLALFFPQQTLISVGESILKL